jgi:hypothetical protein
MKSTLWACLSALLAMTAESSADRCVVGITNNGRVSVNATVVKKFGATSDRVESDFFDDDDSPDPSSAGRWRGLAMEGETWYALRRDGVLMADGRRQDSLRYPGEKGHGYVAVTAGDHDAWALNEDGRLVRDDRVVARFSRQGFDFTDVLWHDGEVYSLRADGSIFAGTVDDPLFSLDGPGDPLGRPEGDVRELTWFALAGDPAGGWLYALRGDGVVRRGDPSGGEFSGEAVGILPRAEAGSFKDSELYAGIALTAAGSLRALRRNGELYAAPVFGAPFIVLPVDGDPDAYVDVEALSGDAYALRKDGQVYDCGDGHHVVTMPGGGYRRFVVSEVVPELSWVKDRSPSAISATVTVVEGDDLYLPLAPWDLETRDVDVRVVGSLPAGLGFEDGPVPALRWTSAGPAGTFRVALEVSDGTKLARRAKQTIVVVPAGGKAGRDDPVALPRIRSLRALAGQKLVFAVPVADPDGDPVTVAADPSSWPFAGGATFDPATALVEWTPGLEDLGERSFRFQVTQGATGTAFTVPVEVDYPLYDLLD